MDFAAEAGAITEAEKTDLKRRTMEAFCIISAAQIRYQNESELWSVR